MLEAEKELTDLVRADVEEVVARKNAENRKWNTGGILARLGLILRGYRP